jgi:hypothetical protein
MRAIWIVIALTSLLLFVAILKFRPWISPGTAVSLGEWKFGSCRCEVWQRRNAVISEPFATALFYQVDEGPWNVVCVDFEDFYNPPLSLREESGRIVVYHWYSRAGSLSPQTGEFEGRTGKVSVTALSKETRPPGLWWTFPKD